MLLPAITGGAPLEREFVVEADAINIWPRCGQTSPPQPTHYYPIWTSEDLVAAKNGYNIV